MEGDNQEEVLFEKPKGSRRWLGKEHHKGKDHLHQILKNEKMIEKTVNFGENQKKMKILDKECGDNLDIDVKYSLNKKQRWNLAENHVDMLKMVPDSIEAQIVERNIMREDAGCFAVHSKIRNEEDPDDFDVRSSYTSGSGQHYSNFSAESRELSEKKKGKKKEENEEEEKYSRPTVIYNIYRAHKSKEIMEISDGKRTKKSRKNRKNYEYREEEEEDYEEEEEDSENEEEDSGEDRRQIMEYSEYIIEKKKEKKMKKKEMAENGRELEGNSKSFEDIFNICEYLNLHPHTLFDSAIHFTNISTKNIEMKNETAKLIEKRIKVDIISDGDIIVDISKWMISNGKKEGQTELLIGITHINKRICRFIINSTIQIQQNNDFVRSKIAISRDFYEAIENISKIFLSNRILNENQRNIKQGLIIDDMYINDNNSNRLMNCEYTLRNGTSIDWSFILDTVHSPSSSDLNYSSNGICSICNQHQFNGLYSNTCSFCISSHFYHQFSSHRIPIDISYSILQRIIPLPILNLYTCQLFENLSNIRNFEKCPNCSTLQTFDIDIDSEWKTDHKCTNCDYEYCSKCRKDCHWPMKCLEFEEWNKQWNIRYCLENAQGNGQETLVRIVCQCRKGIFYVKMPCDEYISCPTCKICISMDKMKVIMKREYVPWSGNCDKWWNNYFHNRKNEENGFDSNLFVVQRDFVPHSMESTPFNKIPAMSKSVIEICNNWRNSRKTGNNIGYLIEMITGWMYMRRNQSENQEEFREIQKILKNLENYRKEEDIAILMKRVNSINK